MRTKLPGRLQWVAGAGKHTYTDRGRLQATIERPIRLPSLHPTCLFGSVLLQRLSLRGEPHSRWKPTRRATRTPAAAQR